MDSALEQGPFEVRHTTGDRFPVASRWREARQCADWLLVRLLYQSEPSIHDLGGQSSRDFSKTIET